MNSISCSESVFTIFCLACAIKLKMWSGWAGDDDPLVLIVVLVTLMRRRYSVSDARAGTRPEDAGSPTPAQQ